MYIIYTHTFAVQVLYNQLCMFESICVIWCNASAPSIFQGRSNWQVSCYALLGGVPTFMATVVQSGLTDTSSIQSFKYIQACLYNIYQYICRVHVPDCTTSLHVYPLMAAVWFNASTLPISRPG